MTFFRNLLISAILATLFTLTAAGCDPVLDSEDIVVPQEEGMCVDSWVDFTVRYFADSNFDGCLSPEEMDDPETDRWIDVAYCGDGGYSYWEVNTRQWMEREPSSFYIPGTASNECEVDDATDDDDASDDDAGDDDDATDDDDASDDDDAGDDDDATDDDDAVDPIGCDDIVYVPGPNWSGTRATTCSPIGSGLVGFQVNAESHTDQWAASNGWNQGTRCHQYGRWEDTDGNVLASYMIAWEAFGMSDPVAYTSSAPAQTNGGCEGQVVP